MVKCKERQEAANNKHQGQSRQDRSQPEKSCQRGPDRQHINRLHQQFSEYGANAKLWLRKCQLLLPEIVRRQVWRRKGFSSIYEYAAKLAGMSRHAVDDALRILRRIEDKPALYQVAAEQGLNKVRPVAAIATSTDQDFWAAKARVMPKNALETYVHNYRLEGRTSTGFQPVKSTVVMQLDPAVAEQLKQLKGDRDWNELMRELVRLAQGRGAEDKEGARNAGVAASDDRANSDQAAVTCAAAASKHTKKPVVKPAAVPAKSRYIPAPIKHYVLNKTGRLCAYPGCLRPYKILHHTKRFALEQAHDPDRLVPLCVGHERIAHRGLIEGELGPVANWRVRKEADPESPLFDVDIKVMQERAAGAR